MPFIQWEEDNTNTSGAASTSSNDEKTIATKKIYDEIVETIESQNQQGTDSSTTGSNTAMMNDYDIFVLCYPLIKSELLTYLHIENNILPEAYQWIECMIDYTIPGGKYNRGTTVLNVVRTILKLAQSEQNTTSNPVVSTQHIILACIGGWMIEILQAFFLVADDIMDDSILRRGEPCWYRYPNINKIAINDSFLLESFVYTLCKKYFSSQEYYIDLLELFLNITQKTEIGQLYDLTTSNNCQPFTKPIVNNIATNTETMTTTDATKVDIDITRFTMERYVKIVQYKTSYYTFYLPLAVGMLLCNINHGKSYTITKDICIQMGIYFQIQDDVLDCYGTTEQIGKVGTDIQENKCSWLIVTAIEQINTLYNNTEKKKDELLTIIQSNYGQWDDSKVKTIKELYKTLNLYQLFQQYEEQSYTSICQQLDEKLVVVDSDDHTNNGNNNNNKAIVPRQVFDTLLKKIYKRSK